MLNIIWIKFLRGGATAFREFALQVEANNYEEDKPGLY